MEKLIFLVVIVIITALHHWWKNRNGPPADEEDQPWPAAPRRQAPPPPPGSNPAPARPQATNWEEELRRLLEGDAPRRPVPPVVMAPAPPPLPAPPRPQPKRQPAAPPPFLARSSIPVPDEGHEEEAGLPVKMPTLAQSAQAYLSARTLDARMAARLKQVSQNVQTHPKFTMQRQPMPAIRQGVALLRDRQSQRAAIIASIVLGPPKALEPAHSS